MLTAKTIPERAFLLKVARRPEETCVVVGQRNDAEYVAGILERNFRPKSGPVTAIAKVTIEDIGPVIRVVERIP